MVSVSTLRGVRSSCYDPFRGDPFVGTIFHEIEVWTYGRWNHKIDSQNKSRSRICLEIKYQFQSCVTHYLTIYHKNQKTQIMNSKHLQQLKIICIHIVTHTLHVYISICIHMHNYYSIMTSSMHVLNILQREIPEKTANTEASELSRSRVGTGRLPNRLGQGATPLDDTTAPGTMVVTLTTWLENVVCCFVFFWFVGRFFLRFTASWVDNVKDSECEMKRDKTCDFGFSTTRLILKLKKDLVLQYKQQSFSLSFQLVSTFFWWIPAFFSFYELKLQEIDDNFHFKWLSRQRASTPLASVPSPKLVMSFMTYESMRLGDCQRLCAWQGKMDTTLAQTCGGLWGLKRGWKGHQGWRYLTRVSMWITMKYV